VTTSYPVYEQDIDRTGISTCICENAPGRGVRHCVVTRKFNKSPNHMVLGPMHVSVSLVEVMVQDQCPNPGNFPLIILHVHRVGLVEECLSRYIL
jgi:hypothetical protein